MRLPVLLSYVIVAYPYSALSAAISSFMARHDNASLPSAKGLAELGVNVRTLLPAGKPPHDAVHQIASSAPHVALAAAEFFKDPSNRTKASDFARAITHMKLVLAAVLRYTLLHPLPEPEPLPGKFTGIDSIYYISKSIVETLIRSSSLPAGELIRERDECTDAVRLAMQLVSMLREYATEITAGTRRLQRILAAAAGVRVNAGALRSQVKTLLPRTSRDSGSPILSNDRKKLEAVKRQLLTSVVEVNEVRCRGSDLCSCNLHVIPQSLSAFTQKQKEMRKEANMLDVNIWTEEPEEAGKVLYFQDKTQYAVLLLDPLLFPPLLSFLRHG